MGFHFGEKQTYNTNIICCSSNPDKILFGWNQISVGDVDPQTSGEKKKSYWTISRHITREITKTCLI